MTGNRPTRKMLQYGLSILLRPVSIAVALCSSAYTKRLARLALSVLAGCLHRLCTREKAAGKGGRYPILEHSPETSYGGFSKGSGMSEPFLDHGLKLTERSYIQALRDEDL